MNSESSQQASINSSTKRVLIVDDDDQLRLLLAERLDLESMEVEQAINGADALTRLRNKSMKPFDVVLTDLNMPLMDGLELIEKSLENGLTIPFVILTGFADKVHTMAALKLGAFAFIEKPFRIDSLVETIKEAIEYSQSLQGIDEELDSLCRGLAGDSSKILQIRKAQRAILVLQKRRKLKSNGVA